jgi:hypothetical protein
MNSYTNIIKNSNKLDCFLYYYTDDESTKRLNYNFLAKEQENELESNKKEDSLNEKTKN